MAKVFKSKPSGKVCVELTSSDYGCCDRRVETPVIFLGEEAFVGILHEDLVPYEPSGDELLTQEHFDNVCKPGCGAETCCYIVVESGGVRCARVSGNQGLMSECKDGKHKAKGENCPGKFGFVP